MTTAVSDSPEERLGLISPNKAELFRLLMEQRSRQAAKIKPFPRHDNRGVVRFPTSWAQKRMWFMHQLGNGSLGYTVNLGLRLRGLLDERALQRALDTIVLRHESLRTTFFSAEGDPIQQISAEGRFALQVIDLRGCNELEREAQVRHSNIEETNGAFDLSLGPLIRGRLLRLQPQESVLLVTMHHIVADGWSKSVFLRELSRLYTALCEGSDAALEPLPLQYADYVKWQHEWLERDELEKQLNYWRARLEGAAQQLHLPTDRPRPSIQGDRGGNVGVFLDAQLSSRLRVFARHRGLTLFMVLYAAWAILLAKLSGQHDVVIGTPTANRRRPELEGLIGLFVNTLLLRVRVHDGLRLEEFLAQVREVTLGAYDHQDIPFEQIVRALQPQRNLHHAPFFQVAFALQNTPKLELNFPQIVTLPEDVVSEPPITDLWLSLEERGDEIAGSLNYASDLFDRQTAKRWSGCFAVLLNEILDGAHHTIRDLTMLSESDRRQVVQQFNVTSVPYPQDRTIHELFEDQVRSTPHAVAVACGGESLTYSQLNHRANQLAWYLREKGVGRERLVGICIERGFEMVVGLLGILKAGGAYVPLDPSYPAERLAYLLSDAAPLVLLTQKRLKHKLPSTVAEVIALDSDWSAIALEPSNDPDGGLIGTRSDCLAYVIYTSGSTGLPKGVMIEHRSLINLVAWHIRAFDLRPGSRSSSVAGFGFDASTWEMWPPLCSGGRLHLPVGACVHPEDLLQWWHAQELEVSFLVTPLAELAYASRVLNPGVQTVLIGGDRLRHWPDSLPDGQSLINNYGPTETTVVATSGRLYREDAVLHIGRPIANAQVYVLDEQLGPVPIGVRGEIHIGGAGVARGYLNRPALTSQSFIADPFSTNSQARLYKTGDLGRWRSDGTIEYIGRNDYQVKIRGFRIELGEIEVQLTQYNEVKEAVVLAREDVPGEMRLVAYVIPRSLSGRAALSVEALHTHLKTMLPEYMVPSALVVLDHFPLTSNGKLDRLALPAPGIDAYVSRQFEAPEGEVEEVLASIWQEVLHVPRVGRKDNFFELGGHSLLATRVTMRIGHLLEVDLPVRILFENPTIQALSKRILEDIEAELSMEAP